MHECTGCGRSIQECEAYPCARRRQWTKESNALSQETAKKLSLVDDAKFEEDGRNLLEQLAEQCVGDSGRWFPTTQVSLAHHCLALAGEVGEVCNIVKKIERGDKSLSDPKVEDDLCEEVADVFIYLLNIAGLLNIDLLDEYQEKRKKNEERWGPK